MNTPEIDFDAVVRYLHTLVGRHVHVSAGGLWVAGTVTLVERHAAADTWWCQIGEEQGTGFLVGPNFSNAFVDLKNPESYALWLSFRDGPTLAIEDERLNEEGRLPEA